MITLQLTSQAALRVLREGPHGVTHLVTGDILDVCDGFMEKARMEGGRTQSIIHSVNDSFRVSPEGV